MLREYAEDRGIFGWTALARALSDAGYNVDGDPPGVSRTAVANWATGQQDAPKDVLPYLERVLELDEEKKARLGYAFAWQQTFEWGVMAA